MFLGMIAKKAGMTQVFLDNGKRIGVSVLLVDKHRVVQVKNKQVDGYDAVQLGCGKIKPKKLTKSLLGHYKKNNIESGAKLKEFRLQDTTDIKVGDEIELIDLFKAGQKIKITGKSKGKGFQGGVKRWNFKTQDATHGNSLAHRKTGSIGQCQFPSRVFKGKKMAGQMGNKRVSLVNAEIFAVHNEEGIILIKGPVIGANNGELLIGFSKRNPINLEEVVNNLTKKREKLSNTSDNKELKEQVNEEVQNLDLDTNNDDNLNVNQVEQKKEKENEN